MAHNVNCNRIYFYLNKYTVMYFIHYTLLRNPIEERNESKLSETKWRYISYNEWT